MGPVAIGVLELKSARTTPRQRGFARAGAE
jgi:hypothetical protein